jgi:tetratricopeptide (TPR) repeat protein
MKLKPLFYVPAFLLTGLLTGVVSVNAENNVPLTSLTKSCKPLINKNLKIPKVAIRGLSERSHKRISRALEKLAEEKYDEAIDLLKKLLESTKDQNVKATVAKYIGIAYAQNNKLIDATNYFAQALDFGKGFLQHKEMQDLTQNVASMHYGNDNKKESLIFLKRWMKNSNEHNDQIYLLYAAILADSNRLNEAVCPAFWAAKMSKSPNKSALGILLNAHFEKKDMLGTIEILKQSILDFPTEKRYWRYLTSVYTQEDKIKDALAVMEMFYVQGYMETSNDYKQLSALFAYNEIPYRTAVVLEEGISKGVVKDTEKNWNNIASNFHVSQELKKAIVAYERAADKSETGEKDLKRAELLADLEEFKKAVAGFDKALQKGSLKDAGRAHYRKGMAYFGMKQYNSSIASLQKATKYKKWRKRAVQWTGYVKTQKKQAAKL